MLGALAARRRGQEPAVRDRSEPDLGERLVRLGRRVRVAERLVGDQQVPRDRLQVGRVAVEHAVAERARPRAGRRARGRSAGSARRPAGRRTSTSSSRFGASGGSPRPGAPRGELLAPLSEQPALSDDEPAEAGLRAGPVRERPAGADRLAGADRRCVDAGSDDLERGHLALAAEQHRVVGQRSRERHPHHLSRPGRERDVGPGALERAQLGDRLLGDHPAGACRDAVGGGDREHPGPPLHPPDAHGVLELSGRLGREQQRQPGVDRGLHGLAEVHHRARVAVLLLARRRPEPPLGEPARRERQAPAARARPYVAPSAPL